MFATTQQPMSSVHQPWQPYHIQAQVLPTYDPCLAEGPAFFIPVEPYYNEVLLVPSSGPWAVNTTYSPWPVNSTEFYEAGPQFQLGMVPQLLPFEGTVEGPTYFFPEEYCLPPTFVATPEEYPGAAETPGMYHTGPAEYGSYGGAYYSPDLEFTPSVQVEPIMEDPAPQHQGETQPPECFLTHQEHKPVVVPAEAEPAPSPEPQRPAVTPPSPEEVDLSLEDKQDKLDGDNLQPQSPQLSTHPVLPDKVVVPAEAEPAPSPEPQHPAVSPPAKEEVDLTSGDTEDQLDGENLQPDSPQPSTHPVVPDKSHEKAAVPLQWGDCDPEADDVSYFDVDVSLWDGDQRTAAKELSAAELNCRLEKLLDDHADNQEVIDWVENNLVEQKSSNIFIRALMTSICRATIICKKPYKLNRAVLKERAGLLWHFLTDEQKELQALYALQALVVELNPRANLLRMFFQCLYDYEVITEEAFFLWEASKDPKEQQGKQMALKSLTTFFIWLHESVHRSTPTSPL